ncbi:MAG: hypothetical protein QOI35_2173 [Cryptosporangiaceae bacterium]|nr:hypothetical protein [Cryptosporangiaceae bacterium]
MTNGRAQDARPVAVGIDGSEPSEHALRFAAVGARRRAAHLRVVWACETSEDPFASAHRASLGWIDARGNRIRMMAGDLVSEVLGRVEGLDGGFRELVLGSVSQQSVHHASCPVTVVHGERCRRSPSPAHPAPAAVTAPLY